MASLVGVRARILAVVAAVTVAQASAQGPPVPPPAVDPTPTVAALDAMDAWLGSGDNGARWRSYLHTDELRAELAKGAGADPALLARALQRFHEGARGLELAPFAAVRAALAQHHAAVQRGYAGDLARLAWASRGDHAPITAEQFAKIRADLRDKVQALDKLLAGNPQNAAAWKAYLKWDVLAQRLDDEFTETSASLVELDEVLRRFRTNEKGLELPAFTSVAQAIAKYRGLVSWAVTARVRDSRPVYERYMADMQRVLDRHRERPTIETVRQIARAMGVVETLGQSPQLVEAIRANYAQPNIFGAVSANFVTRAPSRPIDRVTPVRDCILGTSIFGTAHTLGNVQYNLIDSDDSVQLAIYLRGEAHSQTRGYNGPVRINSTGHTTYWAAKRVVLDENHFVSGAVIADAHLNSRINSIQKTGGQFGARLIEKIAWKRAGEQKGRSERISESHTRDRVVREFEQTVVRDLAAARLRYETQLIAPLTRRGVAPEHLRMRSSRGGVNLETLFAASGQLGAPSPPPPMLPGADLGVQIHQSAINNYLPLALSSARIAQQTAENPPDLQGNVPSWLRVMSVARPNLAAAASAGAEMVGEAQARIADAVGVEPDVTPPPFKPYSITLNSEAPASVSFDDNRASIRVRAASLASDDSEYRNWDFVVTYELRQEGGRILLTRVGEIEAFPTGFDPQWPRQLTAEETGFRSVLKK
ncbi:MAG TPA: hypothetical protein VEQ85_09145, partial [Lacipirellulaceae bacterium]|nr:hypothetical protein [Lacipirellulaceae bacterium]